MGKRPPLLLNLTGTFAYCEPLLTFGATVTHPSCLHLSSLKGWVGWDTPAGKGSPLPGKGWEIRSCWDPSPVSRETLLPFPCCKCQLREEGGLAFSPPGWKRKGCCCGGEDWTRRKHCPASAMRSLPQTVGGGPCTGPVFAMTLPSFRPCWTVGSPQRRPPRWMAMGG